MAVGDLKKWAFKPQHDYISSLLTFPEVNVQKIAADNRLEEKGAERGAQGLPPLGEDSLDQVEAQIVDSIEDIKSKTSLDLSDQLRVLDEHLIGLDLSGYASKIPVTTRDAISRFELSATKALDQLSPLLRRVRETQKDLTAFRKEHKLDRPPHTPSAGEQVLRYGALMLIALVEITGNSIFLSRGSEFGLIGGFAEAIFLAAVNLLTTYLLAIWVFGWVTHRSVIGKFIGLLAIALWVVFTCIYNLAVAHYRESTGAFFDQGGQEALRRMLNSPLGLTDFQSWLMAIIGVLMAIFCAADVYGLKEQYPGYNSRRLRLHKAEAHLTSEREYQLNLLEDEKNDCLEEIEGSRHFLNSLNSQYAASVSHRRRIIEAFDQYIDGLERNANQLLDIYRDANRNARVGGKAPARFRKRWEMVRPVILREVPQFLSDKRRTELLEMGTRGLEVNTNTLQDKFLETVARYKGLQDAAERDEGTINAS